MSFETEKAIAAFLIDLALAKGATISVYNNVDNEGPEIRKSIDRDVVLAALGSTGSDTLTFYLPCGAAPCVVLIWGNGSDLLSDWSASFEREFDVDAILNFAETKISQN